jgi:Protein of unknown function (DUF1565)
MRNNGYHYYLIIVQPNFPSVSSPASEAPFEAIRYPSHALKLHSRSAHPSLAGTLNLDRSKFRGNTMFWSFFFRMTLLGAAFAPPVAGRCQTPPTYIGVAYGSSNSSSEPVTINVPPGTRNDDLMLAYIATQSTTGAWITAPAGWTQVTKTFNSVQGSQLFSRVANNEPSSYTWSGASYPQGAIRTYRGVNATAPIASSAGCTSFSGVSCQIPAFGETSVAGESYVLFWDFNLVSEPIYAPAGLSNYHWNLTERSMISADKALTVAGPTTIPAETATVRGAASHWDGIGVTVRPAVASAPTNYYVATTGSDSNPGTQSAPFLTLQKAASVATAGVTVHVAPGSYVNTTYCSIPGVVNGTTAVCMQTSGTASAPITFISDTKWAAKLTCPSDNAFFILAASYIIVSGFDISCPGSTDGLVGGSYGNNGYNTFSNNYIHDVATSACPETGVLYGSDTSFSPWTNVGHNVFDSNIIHHAGGTTADSPTCDQYHGIYMGEPYSVATNNVISGVVGFGIHAYGGGVCHQTISNNTVFDNSQGGIIAEDDIQYHYDVCANGSTTDYETITNNITANNGYGRSYSGGSYSGDSGGIHLYGAAVGTHNNISGNVAFGNNNFQVSAAKPAVVVNTRTGSNSSVFRNYQPDKNWAPASPYNYQNYLPKPGF